MLLSGESEFIFGDGFLHNISSVANTPHCPRCLIPLTPEIAVFYTRPVSYRTYPKGFVMNLTPDEVSFVNHTVQVYAKRELFFREIHPAIDPVFIKCEHRQYKYDAHPWTTALKQAVANTFFGNDALFFSPEGGT